MIQYVQSRGRARNQHSKFIHMIENGNCAHQQTFGEVRWQENSMRRFCDQLPDDRKLQGNQDHLEALLDREREIQVRIEPTTGAKLTYGNALNYIANFVSAIPTDSDEPQHPTYEVLARGQKFQAEVRIEGYQARSGASDSGVLLETCYARRAPLHCSRPLPW